MAFDVDARLAANSVEIEDWPLCHVRLKTDKTYPWLYLIPRKEGIREMFELSYHDQQNLIREIAAAGMAMKTLYNADKINTAAYGNMVPQLHVHVFARHNTDPAWPKPVWAVQLPEISYNDNEIADELRALKQAFAELRRKGEPI